MKKYLMVIGLSVYSVYSTASMNVYQPIGSSIVLGNYGNRHALSTAAGNPAASYLMANLQGFRVSFLGPVGIAVEGGGIDDINDRVDELEAIFDEDFTSSIDVEAIKTEAQSAPDPDAFVVAKIDEVLADINSSLDSADAVISDISQTTYVKFATTVQAPFLPIIYKTRRRGVFTLDASASLVGRADILADNLTLTGVDELEAVASAADLDGVDVSGADVESDTSVYMKRASDYHFSVGYSEMVSRSETSALIVGGRLNFHRLALDQKLTVLTEDDDSSVSYSDFFLSRDSVSSGVSLDLGLILAARNFQLGASIANVNEPEFDYKGLESNCTGLVGADKASCEAALRFAGEGVFSLKETYKMEAQMTVDAAIKSKDQHFSLAGSYDVNAISDPLGDEYQWATVSLSYFSDNWVLPGMRIGYRKNLVGSELNYYTAGLTFYRRLDVDVAYAPENDEGNSGAFVSVGYSFVF
ncbi:conjugal transfer protein TraF [Marinomonas shanghaiensis]|uniref:conjugal transfer protein TraF n=1 Tax=Marinomonas shanghaiensis TaxID=2202418 RepID=UPI003A921ECB